MHPLVEIVAHTPALQWLHLLPGFFLGELTGADTGGGEKAGDVISGVGHTCFAVLPPSIGPSMSGRYANWGRGITQTGVGVLLPGPMEGECIAKHVWALP